MSDLRTADGGAITSTPIAGNIHAIDVNIAGIPFVQVANFPSVQAVAASSLPLPTGAAAESSLSALNAKVPSNLTVTSTRLLVDGSGVTQPVSAAALPLPSGAATGTKQDTGNTSVANIDTKTPALGQAAMAASRPVVIASNQSAIPVNGTITANIGTAGSLALDATLTGGTQKAIVRSAAKGLTAAADVTSTAVDVNTQALDVQVKNFPATQPVSAASLPLPAGASTSAKQPALGTAGTASTDVLTVQGIASMTALKTDGSGVTQPVSGTLSANQSGTWTVQPGNTANTTAWKVDGSAVTQPVNGTVTANTGTLPTLTKGTQGATGFSMQQLIDAGRNQTNYYMAAPIVSTATDTLMSLTGYKSGAAVTATTTPAVVTAGKTYRITLITISYVTIVTTPGAVKFTLRANLSGVAAIGSPAVKNFIIGEPSGAAPVAGKYNTISIPMPDSMEFPAGTGIGVSMVGLSATGAAAVVGFGHFSADGFEY